MFTIQHHERIGSTNDEAKRLAAAGAPHGTVVHADEQAAGRGRFGKTWYSPPGNLYVSILLRLDLPLIKSGELTFIAALTLADTVDRLLPKQTRAVLKWPNDVLVHGAKIGGILLEREGDAQIAGIGLNILETAKNTPYKTTTIAASGGLATVDYALEVLLDRLEKHLAVWTRDGFAPVRQAWLARAHPAGTKLLVTVGGKEQPGLFAGLAEDGALLLDTPTGQLAIRSGEVVDPAART